MDRLRVCLLMAGAALLSAAPAALATGVSIDVSRITVNQTLQPGGTYKLPAYGVRNPSHETTDYVNSVNYVDGQTDLRPAESWFSFNPSRFTLDGGDSRAVQATIQVPPDAQPGTYSALIGPTIETIGEGASVGASAAAHLTFVVAPSSSLDAMARWLWTLLTEQPWIVLLILLAIAFLVWVYLRRHFKLSISRV